MVKYSDAIKDAEEAIRDEVTKDEKENPKKRIGMKRNFVIMPILFFTD